MNIVTRQDLDNFRHYGLGIPEYMYPGILRYVNQRIIPGQFLQAIICNDLIEAVNRADDYNVKILPVYVCFFYNKTPSDCWGSKEKMLQWVKDRELINA